MFQIKLCATREHDPRHIEHWLHTLQNQRVSVDLILREKEGKVQLFCSEDISMHLPGSRAVPTKLTLPALPYHVTQSKGPLLPIKRHSQFEDRVNKTRIFPMDLLVQHMQQHSGSCFHLNFRTFPEHRRHRWLKKAKRSHFRPERRLDQWESKAWLHWHKLRRYFVPLLRYGLSPQEKSANEQTTSLHEREDPRQAVLDKLSRPLFITHIQSSHPFQAFINGFNLPYLGELRFQKKSSPLVFSAEELTSLISLPDAQNNPHLDHESCAHFPAPPNPLQLPDQDRRRHLYVVGKTGMGKSTALLKLLKQDLESGKNILMLDPHGDLIQNSLSLIPKARHPDLLILDPSQEEWPFALNPVECLPHEKATHKTSALLEMFRSLSQGSWGPRLEYLLRNALLVLCQAPNTTLLDLPRFLTQATYCQRLMAHIQDIELRRAWLDEFLKQDTRQRQEQVAPILNKVGPLLTHPVLRNIFGQARSKCRFEHLFNKPRILLINLCKGKVGEDASRMLGMVFLSLLQSYLLQQAQKAPDERQSIHVFIDEFQNFSTPTLISMLSESRKYGLALTLANQYLTQLPLEIQQAILGNVASFLCFQSHPDDATLLAPLLDLTERDLTGLKPLQCYAKLASQTRFRMDLDPPQSAARTFESHHHKRLGRPRAHVEARLKKRYT